jgi:hypothetical protein
MLNLEILKAKLDRETAEGFFWHFTLIAHIATSTCTLC